MLLEKSFAIVNINLVLAFCDIKLFSLVIFDVLGKDFVSIA